MEIYTIISETEKAIKVKYPYYQITNNSVKKHKQKYIEQWIPKSVSNIEEFVKKNMFKRGVDMKRCVIGIAPEKKEIEPELFDDVEKHKQKWDIFHKKIFDLTGMTAHHRSGFEPCGYCFNVDGKEYDFYDEYIELQKYKPLIKEKRYV